MPEVASQPPSKGATLSDELAGFLKWCREHPIDALLGVAILGALAWFFTGVHLFVNGAETTARWAWLAWNPEQDQEHSKLVVPLALYLFWLHRDEVRKVRKEGDNRGLIFVVVGVLLYVLSARCVQARLALMAIPFLLFGSILFLCGKAVARILLFPCAFLIFLIPFGAIQQTTFKLQFLVTGTVSMIASLLGMALQPGTGTELIARDGSFHFEVAGGCSGIHSIIALTMLSSVYMHIMENTMWKKFVIVACSAIFAIIGNIGRIVTILLVAKFFGANVAGGAYHEYSPWLIFPFAIAAMLGVSKLLNMKFGKFAANAPTDLPKGEKPGHRQGEASYDY